MLDTDWSLWNASMTSNLKKGKDLVASKPPRKSRKKQATEKKDSQGRQLTNEDWNDILDWMEIPGNSTEIEGSENAPAVGGKTYTKMQGCREMVSYLNAQPRNRSKEVEDIDANSMKDRWLYFFKKYKQLKKESLGTGYSVDPATDGVDITDIESKLCKKMSQFKRMDALFGQLPRILEQSREMTLHGIYPTSTDESPINVSSDDQMPFGFPEGDGEFQTQVGNVAPLSIDWDLQQDVPSNVPETGSQRGRVKFEHYSPQTSITPNATGDVPHSPSAQEGGSTQYSPPPGPQDGPATMNSTPPGPPNPGSTGNGNSTPGTGNLKRRKTANVGDVYPKAKQILETRHSINSAFAMNLGEMTAVRRTANEINKAKWAIDMDLKMAQFEEQKRVQQLKEICDDEERLWIMGKDQEDRKERLLDREEKAKDREEKSKTDYQNFMVSLLAASGGSVEKLAELEKVFGSFKR